MINPPIDDLLEKVTDKYTLSVLAAKRAREIIRAGDIVIDGKPQKAVSVALQEIVSGKLTFERTKSGIK